ncbi:MAG: hypothetical protein A2V70_02950 [Planctomycetes bacterium RBG_13_63_9]|nr:MAG: hypothetical protein A2V70_02950 [Planctomycetes bacterium RBG_13_63_9]
MRTLVKWLLAPVVLTAGIALMGAGSAEAAPWRVHAYYGPYRARYVQPYWPAPYYYAGYYGWAAPVPMRVYRPAPVVVPYVPSAVVVPYPVQAYPAYPVYPVYPAYPVW